MQDPSQSGRKQNRQNWRTPPHIFAALSRRFDFAVDAFADDRNHLCDRYFSEKNSAFGQIWGSRGEFVFANPPYKAGWVARAISEAERQHATCGVITVLLVPLTLDTAWAHNALKNHGIFVGRGRVAFVDPDTDRPVSGNPWGSQMIVVGRGRSGVIGTWDCKTGDLL